MKKKITCPLHGCSAVLSYQESPETSRILGATACSLIDGEVDCGQECVHLINMRREAEARARHANDD